ncbi:MAG: peptidoglycan DD-metalloendopeptidase family protein [Planctomycetes bacterium]|nr:peptidoglycan DD-metalloendopeptidase family protein [Planctomycetota bacterium]
MTSFLLAGPQRAVCLVLLLSAGFGVLQAQEVAEITAKDLTGRRFRFNWRQGNSGGFNGILILDRDGQISGISSRNETAWEVDSKGRLLFKHADGRVTTTFESCERRKGQHFFEGPFHLRKGIAHLLEETGDQPAATPPELSQELPSELLMTNQVMFCLDEGADLRVTLASGRTFSIRLLSVHERRDTVVGLIRRAEVCVAINGQQHDLICAPYVMPSVIGDVRIQADTTSGFTTLPGRVQFSAWDAADPIVDLSAFTFPLPDTRFLSHGMQCFNEPIHLGRKDGDPGSGAFYHNYGIDFAGFEGGERVVSCVDGKVVRALSDAVLVDIVDETGLIWEYHHLDSIALGLAKGDVVKRGDVIGVLGRSGSSGNFSHLHVGVFLTPAHMNQGKYSRRLNWYPWMVEAWRASEPDAPLAVSGAHHQVRVGEPFVLDGSYSVSAQQPIVRYQWALPDGTLVDSTKTELSLSEPGIHIAALRVWDSAGHEDVDFHKIKVFSTGEPEPWLPAIFMTSTPTRTVCAGEPVRFRCWLHGAEEGPMRLDFGDGHVTDEYASFSVVEHRFRTPGLHIVTATSEVNGLQTTSKQKVIVRDMIKPNARGIQAPSAWREAASRQGVQCDWMLQDYMSIELPEPLAREKAQWRKKHLRSPEARFDPPVLEKLTCFVSRTDHGVEERMIERVIGELGRGGERLRTALERLADTRLPGCDLAWKALYVQACDARRTKRLAPLVATGRRFVFDQHRQHPASWKYTEGLSDARNHRFFAPGASLEILEMDGAYGRVLTLIDDPLGSIRNPDVSYDGKRILFAWKRADRDDDFHLYELDVATRTLRQLTHGLGFADFEGVYLLNGKILFSSTRCVQSVDCNWVEVSNLFLMWGNGQYMRRIGFDQVHTVFPTVTDDGRVLYTRWDYNDRAQMYTQPLFEMNSDGTGQREFYGGSSWFPTNIIHARQIPGTSKVAAIITGHHTPAHGKLGIIDTRQGRQEGRGIELLAPERVADPVRVDKYGMEGSQWQYVWPLSEEHFLVTLALPEPDGSLGQFNIYLIDRQGRRELLVEGRESGQGIGCRQIVPLAPRSIPHVRPSTVDYRKTTGLVYMQDVYEGLGLPNVARGTIDRLRVVGLEYRAAGVGHAMQEGRGGRADVSTPISVGNGSWDVKVVYGSAKVHEDGSAFFEVPARKALYFQAIDKDGITIQTMRSWTTLMPGETQSCVGCHEHKNSTLRADRARPTAATIKPQQLTPFYGPARGFSYTTEVQPILDRLCVDCHDGREDIPMDLRGTLVHLPEMKRMVANSYLVLTHTQNERGDSHHPMVNWIDSMSEPDMLPPRHRGAAASGLITLLKTGHEGVIVNAEDLEKIACWLDLLVPYCGDYLEHNTWSKKDHAFYDRYAKKRQRQEQFERSNIKALIEQDASRPGPAPADSN